jgi:hypothetical protein
VSAEALVWWVQRYSVPPLVTVGPPGSGGIIGVPGVSVAYNGPGLGEGPRYGGRVTLGKWLTPCWAVEASIFYVTPRTEDFFIDNGSVPAGVIARPFFSANRNAQFSEVVSDPLAAVNPSVGRVEVNSRSMFYGAELNARKKWWENDCYRVDLLCGVRYLYLEEELSITENTRGVGGAIAGIERKVTDDFTTRNNFFGAQVGAIFTYSHGPWTVELRGKVAAGITRQYINIEGQTTPVTGGTTPDLPGGLYALNSNLGVQTRDKFTVVPEIGINIGYDINCHLRVFAGYSLLFISNVARPGPQIDTTLDENRIPDVPAAPAIAQSRPAPFREAQSVWVQGVNVGILFKW